MKRFAKIVLIIPVMLLMLHTLVQHKHVDKNDGGLYIQSCQHEIDFFGLIKHAFEIDERENHLEDIKVAVSENIDFETLAIILQSFSNLKSATDQEEFWPVYTVSLLTDLHIPNLSFRGPPTLS